MGKCLVCGRESLLISDSLGVCRECLLSKPEKSLEAVRVRRASWRRRWGLPPNPPRKGGLKCKLCVNECELSIVDKGYCGVVANVNGRIVGVTGNWSYGVVDWYLDPHPTNCVAVKICPATTDRGYPKYTSTRGVEKGYYNLAVFYAGCSLDCAYCQNWSHREMAYKTSSVKSVEELVNESLNPRVTCVCYFGGDPGPHAPHALKASREILARRRVRICWETNGVENPSIMDRMADLSLESGGIVKIDFKAWSKPVYEALTGVNGVERVKENVERVGGRGAGREPPLLVVSVLLVPGYVTSDEVHKIAEYVASVDENIPIVLLAFHPDYVMNDLPPTSRSHALECIKAAEKGGVREVYLENVWLLGNYY